FWRLSAVEVPLAVVCGGLTFTLVALFIDKVIFVFRQYKTGKKIQSKSIQIVGIYPVVAVCAFIALCFPKATFICLFVRSTYLSCCLYTFISLMVQYMSGKDSMLSRLEDHQIHQISLQAPPCFCCCCCLPKPKATRRNIRILELCVLQNAILSPVIYLVAIVLWLDGKYRTGEFSLTNSYPYLNFLNAFSFIFAMQSFIIFFRMCRDILRPLRIVPKFFSLQLVVILANLQSTIFALFVKQALPACTNGLSANVKGEAYFNMVLIVEMFALSFMARCAYRRSHSNIDAILNTQDATKETETSKYTKSDDNSKPLINGVSKDQSSAEGTPSTTPKKSHDVRNSHIFIDPGALSELQESYV
ncbi:organic solute transporter subunit alpha, partial [Aplysia californica]|uniref:Organic solute transporter subunit alpha n=1 Tax=Aplysia californica TaxID=6500 RepID=A0ABM0KA40_APLCA